MQRYEDITGVSMDNMVKLQTKTYCLARKENATLKRTTLFMAVVLFLTLGNTAYAFFGSTDYTGMTAEKAAATIKKLDSQIQDVQIVPHEGKEVPIITFRAGVVKDPLLEESADLKDIAEKIATAKGSERFFGIQFSLVIPAVDNKGNKVDAKSLDMLWKMETLKGVNWKGFQNWQFLDLIDAFNSSGPMSRDVIQSYCEENRSYAQEFCRSINAAR